MLICDLNRYWFVWGKLVSNPQPSATSPAVYQSNPVSGSSSIILCSRKRAVEIQSQYMWKINGPIYRPSDALQLVLAPQNPDCLDETDRVRKALMNKLIVLAHAPVIVEAGYLTASSKQKCGLSLKPFRSSYSSCIMSRKFLQKE